MNDPGGVTEESFLAAVNRVVGALSAKHQFGSHDKDDNLNKAHVRYLEARLCALARDAKLVAMECGSMPLDSAGLVAISCRPGKAGEDVQAPQVPSSP